MSSVDTPSETEHNMSMDAAPALPFISLFSCTTVYLTKGCGLENELQLLT